MMDREEILENGVPESGYLWCLHCGRAYPYGSYREEVLRVPAEMPRVLSMMIRSVVGADDDELRGMDGNRLQMCPYSDCDGDTVLDAWNWEDIRNRHPEYPEVPEYGCVYPL